MQEKSMSCQTSADTLKIVHEADGLEVDLLPLQGLWTEAQYLRLTDETNHLIEFTDGVIEVLPMPTDSHQVLLLFLYDLLKAFIQARGGKVLVAPLRVRIRPGKYREPDILLVRDAHDPRRQNAFWLGADLVMEIVSPDNPERDTEQKPVDYADAGIPEYWIINPLDETVSVLNLQDHGYTERTVYGQGETAASTVLQGFAVCVDEIFDSR
jgi:Uma2 family endonuclease